MYQGAFKHHLVVEINMLVIDQIKDITSSSQVQTSILFSNQESVQT